MRNSCIPPILVSLPPRPPETRDCNPGFRSLNSTCDGVPLPWSLVDRTFWNVGIISGVTVSSCFGWSCTSPPVGLGCSYNLFCFTWFTIGPGVTIGLDEPSPAKEASPP